MTGPFAWMAQQHGTPPACRAHGPEDCAELLDALGLGEAQ